MAATDVKNDANLSTSLVSYWELEEASGTRVDSHGSNDLTDNNTVLSATGIQGTGADFETTNSEYLSITDAAQSGLDLTASQSYSFWVKFESLPTSGNLMNLANKWTGGTDRSFLIDLYNNGGTTSLRFILYNSSASTASYVWTPSTGTWYHIVAVYDGPNTDSFLYVDGSQVASDTSSLSSVKNSNSDFVIGSQNGSFWYFDGVIDEFGVWSKPLTSTEITDLYNSGSGIPYDAGGGGGVTFIPRVSWFS